MSTVISVENVSKQYRLGEVGTGTMAHDVNRWWHKVRGKADPYLMIGETNDREKKGSSDYSWALREISFEVKKGEVLGLIGRNGAGKSTLLKILSRVTQPTTGDIKVKGRIASLLEVGTGFHPELTGRENIFLNGAILGMRREEIQRKLDEIIEFSGCDRYIETPVKRYSSGMYVRLAFAVAAHLEPEILIVDEVLAVGDMEFQKKCIGKMKDVAGQGRTVIFVSHNLAAVRKLCTKCLLMSNGTAETVGETSDVITKYLGEASAELFSQEPQTNGDPTIINAQIVYPDSSCNEIMLNLQINSGFEQRTCLDLRFNDRSNVPVGFSSLGTFDDFKKVHLKPGNTHLTISINAKSLAVGLYRLSIDLTEPNVRYFNRCEDALSFEITRPPLSGGQRPFDQQWDYGSSEIPICLK